MLRRMVILCSIVCQFLSIGFANAADMSPVTKEELKSATHVLLHSLSGMDLENPSCLKLGQVTMAMRNYAEIAKLAKWRGETLDGSLTNTIRDFMFYSVSLGSYCGERGIKVLGGEDVTSAKLIDVSDVKSVQTIVDIVQNVQEEILKKLGAVVVKVPLK